MDILNSPIFTLGILVADVVLIWVLIKNYRAMRRVDEQLARMEANAKELDHLLLRKKPDTTEPIDDTIPF